MSMQTAYEALVAGGEIEADEEQQALLPKFDALILALEKKLAAHGKKRWPWRKRTSLRGIYLYGEVGTGKTFLMDLFFQELTTARKGRFHFHHFMQQIDVQLRRLQGHPDPLRQIARELSQSISVLCFDEFLVYDVVQAMILGELLQALFEQGLILVATSNTIPDELYSQGVQRERFLPAIALLKSHCSLLQLSHQRDYRLAREQALETYFYPLTQENEQKLVEQFNILENELTEHGVLKIQNRDIAYICCSDKTVWFDFNVLCYLPRSQLDYLELAERFSTIFLSGVPVLTEQSSVSVILFIQLVDVLYDRGIRLVMSAAAPLNALYPAGAISGEFKRTLSRLEEMQSLDYRRRHLARPVCHLLPASPCK